MSDDALPIFISPEQLHAVLDWPDVQVVAVDDAAGFAQAHVPGALRIDLARIVASEPPVAGLVPDTATLAAAFSEAGLRNDAHIVAYDRSGGSQAARLLYTLDTVDHSAISLLDGGLQAWHADGFELASDEAGRSVSQFEITPRPERIADGEWITAHLEDGTQFIDARSAAEYTGDDVRSARGGHIPGAVNLDWNRMKDAQGRLLPKADLAQMLADQGIDENRETAVYCQSHMRSAYTYLVLKTLGHTKVRGYPGSWSDWGNRDDTPVSQGNN